ncbi:hypothetical protein [Streptomyces cadmiisoli]|uniref:hypothetical protein n=1 Tax=Streptomyces cadmiisoli TaxID=2184053 RepID=UPI00365750E5
MTALTLTLGSTGTGFVTAPAAYAIDPSRGTPGYCPNANGVTVIVDFQELGGTTLVRCAPGEQATGLTALKNAGIQIAGTNRWGEAFICRIEAKPGPESEPCIDTPPASAYWSYWHAPNGGNWTYSQWGVMNRKPPPGSFEGWSFSKDKTSTTNPPPRISPVRPVSGPPSGSGGSGNSGGSGGSGGSGNAGGSGGSGGSDSGGSSSGAGSTSGSSSSGGSAASGGSSGGGAAADGGGGGGGAASPGRDKRSESDSPKSDQADKSAAKDASVAPSTSASDEPLPGTDVQPSEAAKWTGVGKDGMQTVNTAADDGIPVSTLAGIGGAAVLAAAAGITAWRRRQDAAGSGDTL